MLGVDIPLLTDWEGDAIRAFGVARDVSGMSSVGRRSTFLVEDGSSIRAAWMLETPELDVDAAIAAARG